MKRLKTTIFGIADQRILWILKLGIDYQMLIVEYFAIEKSNFQ